MSVELGTYARVGAEAAAVDSFDDDDVLELDTDTTHLAGRGRVTINTFLAFFGAAILSTPYAFRAVGLALGTATLITVGVMCVYCMVLLIRCKRMLLAHKAESYSDVCKHSLGQGGLVVAETALVVTQVNPRFLSHSIARSAALPEL